jgi:hypothetical protein
VHGASGYGGICPRAGERRSTPVGPTALPEPLAVIVRGGFASSGSEHGSVRRAEPGRAVPAGGSAA